MAFFYAQYLKERFLVIDQHIRLLSKVFDICKCTFYYDLLSIENT